MNLPERRLRESVPELHYSSAYRRSLSLVVPTSVNGSTLVGAQRPNATPLTTDGLSTIWRDITEGRLIIHCELTCERRSYLLVRKSTYAGAHRHALNRIEAAILLRVLRGEQQKVVAAELGIACSTVSKWYTLALAKLNLKHGCVSLPFIIAAQSTEYYGPVTIDARTANIMDEGIEFRFLSVPRPSVPERTCLSMAEQAIAKLLIEGESRCGIAHVRSTSIQTVACQLRGIFAKFRVTGRHALIGHAAGLGWFQ